MVPGELTFGKCLPRSPPGKLSPKGRHLVEMRLARLKSKPADMSGNVDCFFHKNLVYVSTIVSNRFSSDSESSFVPFKPWLKLDADDSSQI